MLDTDEIRCESYKIFDYDSYINSSECIPDVFMLWTPRNSIINFYDRCINKYNKKIPYVLHMEDNETVITKSSMNLSEHDFYELSRFARMEVPEHLSDPKRASSFMNDACGLSALTEEMLFSIDLNIPKTFFWPGYDPTLERFSYLEVLKTKYEFGIGKDIYLTAYTGNVHSSNLKEVRSLYLAIALANRAGVPIRLIRTGNDYIDLFTPDEWRVINKYIINLGFVSKATLNKILKSCDILIQPGVDDDWNKYRFPSKVPEFLASGKPVILPKTNIGLALINGYNALVLDPADANQIASCLIHWLPRRNHLLKIGLRGRSFAKNNLQWSNAAIKVRELLNNVLGIY